MRATIPLFPFAQAFADARLDDIRQETVQNATDLIIDFREIRLSSETELIQQDGAWAEHVRGEFLPRRVRFKHVTIKTLEGEFTDLAAVPADHKARILVGMLTWRLSGEKQPSYRLFNGAPAADLWFSAPSCMVEQRETPLEPANFIRTHSPSPPLPEGLIYRSPKLYRRFGGDPVTIRIGNRVFHQRLFAGSLGEQSAQRPEAVDAVLNLGEERSKWVSPPAKTALECDRWVEKGEGAAGMSGEELRAEAAWVIERLRKHQRVLVHCVAGFNRSVTVCVAVLMLLEGLTPETALARVREHHPWAKPDPVHWLKLKGLAVRP
jgi:hypothetical protein